MVNLPRLLNAFISSSQPRAGGIPVVIQVISIQASRHTIVTGLFCQSAEILLPTWLLRLQFWHRQSLQGPPANFSLASPMTQEQIQALIQAVRSSPELQQKLAAATNNDDAARIAAEAGFELSSDDINEAITGTSIELTDAELEMVAGGGWGDLVGSFANNGDSCGNAVQKLTCNIKDVI